MKVSFTFLKNMFSLSTNNVISIVVNIAAMPILINNLGLEGYGEYIYIFILSQFLLMIVNFSFDLFCVNECKGDLKVAEILIGKVILIRLALFFLGTLSILSFLYFMGTFNYGAVNFILMAAILPLTLNFSWYFQLTHEMHYIAITNITGKLLYVIFIILPIEKSAEYFAIAYLISNIIIYLLNYYILKVKFKVVIDLTFDFKELLEVFKKASSIFSYQVLVGVLPAVNASFANSAGGGVFVALFDVFSKFTNVLNTFFITILQVLFPKMMQLKDNQMLLTLVFNYIIALSTSILLLLFTLYFFNDHVVEFINYTLKVDLKNNVLMLQIGGLVVFMSSLNSLLSRLMIRIDKIKIINISTMFGFVSTVALTPIFIDMSTANGLFIAILNAQFIIFITMLFLDFKKWRLFKAN